MQPTSAQQPRVSDTAFVRLFYLLPLTELRCMHRLATIQPSPIGFQVHDAYQDLQPNRCGFAVLVKDTPWPTFCDISSGNVSAQTNNCGVTPNLRVASL